MIEVFKEMVDNGLAGWELELAGGSTAGQAHEDYLQQLFRAAQGYPIRIRADLAYDDLIKLYGESAIYWHATGYGEDEAAEPVKMEHFGITTVEAMASGCVPIVIARGGQPEIVQDGMSGLLWETKDEFKSQTLRVARDPALLERLSRGALESSRAYDFKHFEARLGELLARVGFAV